MKVFLIFFPLLFTISCCISRTSQVKIRQEEGYKIYRIDSINSFYLIYCEKEGQKYKIVSKKADDIPKGSKKIEIGESFNLTLKLFPEENKNNPLANSSILVDCFTFDPNTTICKENGMHGLHTTENLKGLFYNINKIQ